MPNSYSVVPGIVPGSLTVGGTLTATGRIVGQADEALSLPISIGGTASTTLRAFNDGGIGPGISTNLNAAGVRGDATQAAYALVLDALNKKLLWRMMNAAGNSMDMAAVLMLLSSYVPVAHTGTTTADQLFSKLIRGGLLAANNGIKLVTAWRVTVQGAIATTVSINYGGTGLQFTYTANNGPYVLEAWILPDNNTGQQIAVLRVSPNAASPTVVETTLNIDSTVDQTLEVRVASGATTDSQSFRFCYAQLLNTFGPV